MTCRVQQYSSTAKYSSTAVVQWHVCYDQFYAVYAFLVEHSRLGEDIMCSLLDFSSLARVCRCTLESTLFEASRLAVSNSAPRKTPRSPSPPQVSSSLLGNGSRSLAACVRKDTAAATPNSLTRSHTLQRHPSLRRLVSVTRLDTSSAHTEGESLLAKTNNTEHNPDVDHQVFHLKIFRGSRIT